MTKAIYSKDHVYAVEQLKKARLEIGLDQKQVAELLSKTQSHVSKVETGQRRIDVVALREFATIYKKIYLISSNNMNRRQIIILVDKLAKDNLTFGEYAQRLEKELECLTLEELKESLLECGVIPESFGHDSSEEKLYSKYTDILLAKAFNFLGINARIVKQRADSADVEGSTKEYSIVGDAKAFRLSRTAKIRRILRLRR